MPVTRNRTPYKMTKGCSKCGQTDSAEFYSTSVWCRRCHKDAVYQGRLRKIGMTEQTEAALREAQQHRCAICQREDKLFGRALHMDHNHVTNQARELLCPRCNQLLGRAEESADLLRKLADYLDRWR